MQKLMSRILISGAPFILLISLWYVLHLFVLPDSSSLPSPQDTFFALVNERDVLLIGSVVSLFRITMGVALGGLFAFIASAVVSSSSGARASLGKAIALLAPIPVIVWLPLSISLFGDGNLQKILLISAASFFLLFLAMLDGFDTHKNQYIQLFDLYNRGIVYRLKNLYFPIAALSAGSVLKIAFAFAWVVLFIAEFGGTLDLGGLGYYIRNSYNLGRSEQVYAGAVFLGVVACITEVLITISISRLLSWKEK